MAAGAYLRLVSEDCNSPQRKEYYCCANRPLKDSSTLSVALRLVQHPIEGGTHIIRGGLDNEYQVSSSVWWVAFIRNMTTLSFYSITYLCLWTPVRLTKNILELRYLLGITPNYRIFLLFGKSACPLKSIVVVSPKDDTHSTSSSTQKSCSNHPFNPPLCGFFSEVCPKRTHYFHVKLAPTSE